MKKIKSTAYQDGTEEQNISGSILPDMKLASTPQVSLNPQEAKVCSLLKKHGTITQFIASDEKIMRLAARIYDLKSKGAVISTIVMDTRHNEDFHPHVAFYTLKGWKKFDEVALVSEEMKDV